uniref:Secreted protein n=1 Tax=Plectus sambesii TaxID=2011161 RepID=A0A914VJH9_9BILA
MFGRQSTIFLLWIAYSVAVSHRCSRCPRNVASDANESAPKSLISQSKQELLKKLGLKQRPPLDAFSQFRAPLRNYMDELKMVDEDDAVIETKEMFIFGQRDMSCESHSGSVCVTFNVSIDASQTILSASLRVNLKKERTVAPVLLQVTNADGSLVIGGEGK